MRIVYIIYTCLAVSYGQGLRAQAGCTDPQALNFNAGATANDGSCLYPQTNYTVSIKTPLNTVLNETSGLVYAGGRLWTHNDSDQAPAIYQIDTSSGQILQTVTIGGVSVVDWEDMAFDGAHLYVGDFGNNANGNRTDLVVYKFPLSAIPAGTDGMVPASAVEWIQFSYEDQTDYTPQGANNTRFDCEAMIVRDGQIHLFTKNWLENNTTHYTIPASEGTYVAQKQETLAADGLVTGADISASGVIVLSGYRLSSGVCFMWLLFDYTGAGFFSGNKRRIELGSVLLAGQVEGICLRENGYGYLSNERTLNLLPARLYTFSIGQWLPAALLPAGDGLKKNDGWCARLSGSTHLEALAGRLASVPNELLGIVWSAQGRAVWQGAATGISALKLDNPGVYYLQLMANGQSCTARFWVP